ncbi:NAD-dependent epimerase/dehydratase family protein [Kitasatospora sp. NPDC054939]
MRIAVTGAAGFCGSHVARAADALGLDVLCVGRRPGPVGRHIPWDATTGEPDLVGADLVVHCAAAVGDPRPGSPAEAGHHAVNVLGTERLLRAAAGRPVVQVSSASVYDPRRVGGAPVREDHPTEGGHLNAYGRTKAAGERLALAAGAVVLRPRAVYGPGDPHLLPRLRERVRGGVLLLPGRDVALSLTAVQNLADACLAAVGATADRPWEPGAYNIADAHAYQRDDAVRRVLAAYGVPVRVGRLPAPLARLAARSGRIPGLTPYAVDQLCRGMVLDTGRARAQGWTPRWDLDRVLSENRPVRSEN